MELKRLPTFRFSYAEVCAMIGPISVIVVVGALADADRHRQHILARG